MKNVSLRRALLASGWMLAVMGLARAGEGAVELWNRRTEELNTARERLSRLHGWLAVEQEVTAREGDLLGPLVLADRSDWFWTGLESLQGLAAAQGLSVKELRPSETPGEGGHPAAVQLDVRLEGRPEQMGPFLRWIPEKMPGVRLEGLQLLPQEKGRIQVLLRLSMPAWERP